MEECDDTFSSCERKGNTGPRKDEFGFPILTEDGLDVDPYEQPIISIFIVYVMRKPVGSLVLTSDKI